VFALISPHYTPTSVHSIHTHTHLTSVFVVSELTSPLTFEQITHHSGNVQL